MTGHLVHTLRRQVTNWGLGHALLLDTGVPERWSVIDAYGEMECLGDSLKTDEQISRWDIVFDPRTPSLYRGVTNLPTGSVLQCDDQVCAIKLAQHENDPSWLVFNASQSVDLVFEEDIRKSWSLVYVPVEDKLWARLHGLNPNPSRDQIEVWT